MLLFYLADDNLAHGEQLPGLEQMRGRKRTSFFAALLHQSNNHLHAIKIQMIRTF